MSQIVTITSQGQLTIPRAIRRHFQMHGSVKASLRLENGAIVVEPQADFWSLAGSLVSKRSLTDAQLRKARETFQKSWANAE